MVTSRPFLEGNTERYSLEKEEPQGEEVVSGRNEQMRLVVLVHGHSLDCVEQNRQNQEGKEQCAVAEQAAGSSSEKTGGAPARHRESGFGRNAVPEGGQHTPYACPPGRRLRRGKSDVVCSQTPVPASCISIPKHQLEITYPLRNETYILNHLGAIRKK